MLIVRQEQYKMFEAFVLLMTHKNLNCLLIEILILKC